jgi:hypothetical protein
MLGQCSTGQSAPTMTEGWHRRINAKVHRHNLPFYQLVQFLHGEASLVSVQAQFVSDDKLRRNQRQKTVNNKKKYSNCGRDSLQMIWTPKICLWKSATFIGIQRGFEHFLGKKQMLMSDCS